jgi:hypothetical protein
MLIAQRPLRAVTGTPPSKSLMRACALVRSPLCAEG